MRAILYLVRKEIKNMLLDMLRHPARLILYIGVLAMLFFSIVSKMEAKTAAHYLNFSILHGVYFAILLFISVPSVLNGLKSGATFFRMSDVNFLFVSPISSKTILAYGLLKQMGSTLLMMVFLLFYGGMASDAFGVVPWQIVTLVAGIALMVFTIQVITLLIYSFSSGRPQRVRNVKLCLYGLVTLMVGYVFVSFLANGSTLDALYRALVSPVLTFIPIVGWIKGMIFGIITGSTIDAISYGIVNVITLAASILLFSKSNSDYYEDVLQSTESTFEMKKAVKEGRSFRNRAEKPVKVRDTGINHGWGANTFFFKHVRQSLRRNRIPFLGVSTLVLAAINLILAVFIRSIAGTDAEQISAGILMAIALMVSCYILFFFNAVGEWSMELTKPYIYLVPEKPFAKLVWASLSNVMKPALDGLVIFAALGIFLHANPATVLLCILLYASVGLLFTAGNVLSQRLFGQVVNKGIVMFVYIIVLMILLAPGIALSALVYFVAGYLPGLLIGMPIFIWNVAVSLGIFAACRNLLSTAEFNS